MQIDRLGVHDSVVGVFPPERLVSTLSEVHPGVSVVGDDEIGEYDGIVTLAHRDAFLEIDWVHSIQAGYDRFPLPEFEEAGTTLTNSAGIHGTSVGETVLGYMLSFARRHHRYRDYQREPVWRRPAWDEAFTLSGESLCVVGLGTIGTGIAERAAALGMEVVGVRRSGEQVEGVNEVYTPDDLREAVSGATFVAVSVPLSGETEGLIDADALAAMDEEAYLINVSRGSVVDQDALVEALEAGGIRGAALDVFEVEPLPQDSPLWGMDEVIVTPHASAYTREYYEDVAELVIENLRRIEENGDLTNRLV
jgi:D-2-hydroxyacid dehydrogenase (NADP+)